MHVLESWVVVNWAHGEMFARGPDLVSAPAPCCHPTFAPMASHDPADLFRYCPSQPDAPRRADSNKFSRHSSPHVHLYLL